MEDYQKEKILYRILSGRTMIKELRLDVRAPSLDLLYESEEIYSEYYEKSGVLSKEELRQILLGNGIISKEDYDYLNKFKDILESLQKELCANFENEQANSIRKLINQARDRYLKINLDLSKYETYSKEGLASYAKSIFLIRNTTYKNNKLYDFSDKQPIRVLEFINQKTISNIDIREIAKSSSWSNIWFSFKNLYIFEKFPSTEQQLLVMWSKLYDNIRESEEKPSEELIMDNDAIDGWLIINREKSDKKSKENKSKMKFNSKIANSEEVFVMARSKEDIDRVNKMNSVHAERIKKQRLQQIYEAGNIDQHNLMDVRMDIQEKFHKMQVDKVRNK